MTDGGNVILQAQQNTVITITVTNVSKVINTNMFFKTMSLDKDEKQACYTPERHYFDV